MAAGSAGFSAAVTQFPLDHVTRLRFARRERYCVPGRCQPIAAADPARRREVGQHLVEQHRRGVREQPLARFLARQTLRQRVRRVMVAHERLAGARPAHRREARERTARPGRASTRPAARRRSIVAAHVAPARRRRAPSALPAARPAGPALLDHQRDRPIVWPLARRAAPAARSVARAEAVRTPVRGACGSRMTPPAIVTGGE